MLRIAIPLALSGVVRYAVELANMYWVGKLGVAALSIVTGLGTFMSLSKMFAGFTSAGTSATIGRMIGEGQVRDAVRTAQKVTAVSLVLGAIVAAFAACFGGHALSALGLEGAPRLDAAKYLAVLVAGLPLSFGMMTVNATLVGLGHSKAALRTASASLIVAFATTPTLLVLFKTGVWGAACAQVMGDAVGYVIGLRAIRIASAGHEVLELRARFRNLKDLWPVVKIGIPLTLDAVVHGSVWFLLIAFLARYGNEFVAAQGTEERFTQILNLPTEGLAPAAATLVGYHLGRGERSQALKVVWTALAMVVAVAVLGGILLRLAPGSLVAWLCADGAYVAIGVRVLAVASMGLVFLAARDVMEASFGGAGNAVPPVIIGLVVALARFPIAYLVAVRLGLGGIGVTWAVNGTLILQAVALVVWFRLRFVRMTATPPEPSLPSGDIPALDAAEPTRSAS
jgi:putative MATE family efflux protein